MCPVAHQWFIVRIDNAERAILTQLQIDYLCSTGKLVTVISGAFRSFTDANECWGGI